jgi:hypothetical protein
MSTYYKAILGVGYIIPRAKATEIYTEYPEFEDNLHPLDGWWEKTDYFFGEIFYKCGPGEEREIHLLGELMMASERVEKTLGTILNVKEDYPAGIHLIHQVD